MYLLINCISTKSAPHILSIKNEYTLHFLNYLITGMSNSSANYWFDMILLLTVPPEVLAAALSARVADVSISLNSLSRNV